MITTTSPIPLSSRRRYAGQASPARTKAKTKPNQVLKVTLSNRDVLKEKQSLWLQIDLLAPRLKSKTKRLPLDIVCVVDCSGSMGYGPNSARDQALRATEFLLGRLGGDDRSAVVLYDGKVVVAKELSSDHQEGQNKLHNVSLGGMTALAPALYRGIDLVGRGNAKRNQWVFILSDGQANVGDTAIDTIASQVALARKRGIKVSSFGLGADYDEELMEALAVAGGGGYHYLTSADDAASAFNKELNDLFTVGIREAEITLKTQNGTKIKRLLGLNSKGSPIAVGDIPQGVGRTLLVELEINPKSLGSLKMVDVEASWKTAGVKVKEVKEEAEISTRITTDEDKVSRGVDANVMAKVIEMEAAFAQAEAARAADAGDYVRARGLIMSSIEQLGVASKWGLASSTETAVTNKYAELQEGLVSLSSQHWNSSTAKALRHNSYVTRNSKKNNHTVGGE